MGETKTSNKRFTGSSLYANSTKRFKESESIESRTTNNHALKSFMSSHWQQVPKLLKKEAEKRRKLKSKRKQEEAKKATLYNIPQNQEFSNAMFDSLEINRMGKATSHNGPTNGSTPHELPRQVPPKPTHGGDPYTNFVQPEGVYKQPDPNYSMPQHSYPQGGAKQGGNYQEDLFMISKNGKRQNGDIYYSHPNDPKKK